MASSSRADGRQASESRQISTVLGSLSRADGSARFSFGSTSSLASFAGPIEVRLREELPDRATLEITHRPLEGVGATPSRSLEISLISALTPLLALSQHPRSLIQLVIQSLSSPSTSYHTTTVPDAPEGPIEHSWPPSKPSTSTSDPAAPAPLGSLSFAERASALNAASLAILDAGAVSLRAVPLAISLAYVPAELYVDVIGDMAEDEENHNEMQLVVDPSADEESSAKSRFVFGWAFGEGVSTSGKRRQGGEDVEMTGQVVEGGEAELIWVESEGLFTKVEFDAALSQSRVAASHMLGTIREQLIQHVTSKRI